MVNFKHFIKIVLFVLFYTLQFFNIYAQQQTCPPVKAEIPLTDWYIQPYDSTFTDTTCEWSQGYDHIYFSNHFHSLVYDNYLYNAYPVYIKYYEVEGALIEKIDMKSGEVIWQQHFDLRNNNAQEIPAYLHVNDAKQLEIGSYRRVGAPGNGSFFFGFTRSEIDPCVLTTRFYDLESGELINSNIPDQSNLAVKNISKKTTPSNNTCFLNDTSYVYVSESRKELFLDIIDKRTGIPIESNKLLKKVKEPYDTTNYFISSFMKNVFFGKDTLVRLNMVQPIGGEIIDYQATLQLYNNKLELKKEVSVTKYMTEKFRRISLVYVDKRYIIMEVSREFSIADTSTHEYIIVDWNGDLIHHKKVIHEGKRYNFVQFYALPEYGEFLMIGKPYSLKVLDFLHLDYGGNFTIKNRINFTEDRAIIAVQFLYMNNDDLILRTSIGKYQKEGFTSECTHITAKINKNIFISSTADIEVTTIKSYPNPSSGPLILDIKGITAKADVRIFDMLGHNVYVQDGITDGETMMDLSGLAVGIYIFKIYQGSKEIGSGQWVRI